MSTYQSLNHEQQQMIDRSVFKFQEYYAEYFENIHGEDAKRIFNHMAEQCARSYRHKTMTKDGDIITIPRNVLYSARGMQVCDWKAENIEVAEQIPDLEPMGPMDAHFNPRQSYPVEHLKFEPWNYFVDLKFGVKLADRVAISEKAREDLKPFIIRHDHMEEQLDTTRKYLQDYREDAAKYAEEADKLQREVDRFKNAGWIDRLFYLFTGAI